MLDNSGCLPPRAQRAQRKRLRRSHIEPADYSVDAFLKTRDVNVDQQAKMVAAELQVGQELGFVDGQQLRSCLEFYDDRLLDKQIKSVAELDLEPIIEDRQRKL